MRSHAAVPSRLRRIALAVALGAGATVLLVALSGPTRASGTCVIGTVCIDLGPTPIPGLPVSVPGGGAPPQPVPSPSQASISIPGLGPLPPAGASPSLPPAHPGAATAAVGTAAPAPGLPGDQAAGPAAIGAGSSGLSDTGAGPPGAASATRAPASIGVPLRVAGTPGSAVVPGSAVTARAPATPALAPPPAVAVLGPVSGIGFGHAPFLWPGLVVLNMAALVALLLTIRRGWARPGD